LISLLESPELRNNAAAALRRIGVTKEHVRTLIQLLKHNNIRTRQLAAINLARIGSDAKSAADSLIAMLADRQVQEFAIHALGQIKSEGAIPRLIKLLRNESYHIRAGTVEALGHFGPLAEQAIPALKIACDDRHPVTRQHAKRALSRIKSK